MSQREKSQATDAQTVPTCPHCDAPLDRVECSKRPTVERIGLSYPNFVLIAACPTCHKALGAFYA